MSPLGALNFLVLQWLGVRLALFGESDKPGWSGFMLLVGVVPLTGWWSRYIGPWKQVVLLRWR